MSLLLLLAFACSRPIPLQTMAVEPAPLDLSGADPTRGEHLARAVLACTECHGDDLAGTEMTSGFPVGRLVAPNLTTLDYQSADWIRAIRHGVAADGRTLVLMPSDDYAVLSARDLADVVAWLETLEPVAHELPESRLGPIGQMLVKKGDWPRTAERIDHAAPVPGTAPASEATLARGSYLATVSGCSGCHAGGPGKSMGPGVRSANLTPHEDGLAGWDRDDFAAALQQGRRPDGSTLDPMMPWRHYAALPPADVDALWAWTQSLPAQPDP
ncbi:MAG: cytochrome c [Alphaproteobacteria bacterium]|nr:cytochrome c [Alphaproteobacteria bacterium]